MIKGDLIKLGVKEGDTLNLKISIRSIGKVRAEDVIIDILDIIGPRGTIVAESFVNSYHISELKRNKYSSNRYTESYAGAVANQMICWPGAVRSFHPIQKFTAIGYRADELMNHGPDDYAYEPLRVMALTGGKNLRIGDRVIGVGTTHVAIGMLGLKQNIPKEGVYYWAGRRVLFRRNWAGGCAVGFNNMLPMYIGNKGKVGNANAMLTDMKDTLSLEMALIRNDPTEFMCGKCIDCRYSWAHSTGFAKKIVLPLLRTYNRWKRIINTTA